MEDERVFVGKFVTSSMSMPSGVAAGAGPPRVKSPDRLMGYCFDTSLAWVVRGIKTRRSREGWFGWWLNLFDGVNQIETETDEFSTCIRRMHRGELSNEVLLLWFGVKVPFLFPFLFFFPPPGSTLWWSIAVLTADSGAAGAGRRRRMIIVIIIVAIHLFYLEEE